LEKRENFKRNLYTVHDITELCNVLKYFFHKSKFKVKIFVSDGFLKLMKEGILTAIMATSAAAEKT